MTTATHATLSDLRGSIRNALGLNAEALPDAVADDAVRRSYRTVVEFGDWPELAGSYLAGYVTGDDGRRFLPLPNQTRKVTAVRSPDRTLVNIAHQAALELYAKDTPESAPANWSYSPQPIQYGTETAFFGGVYIWPVNPSDATRYTVEVINEPDIWPNAATGPASPVPIPGGYLPPGLANALTYLSIAEGFLSANKVEEAQGWKRNGLEALAIRLSTSNPTTSTRGLVWGRPSNVDLRRTRGYYRDPTVYTPTV